MQCRRESPQQGAHHGARQYGTEWRKAKLWNSYTFETGQGRLLGNLTKSGQKSDGYAGRGAHTTGQSQ
jgi:hypothetical protein